MGEDPVRSAQGAIKQLVVLNVGKAQYGRCQHWRLFSCFW